MTNFSRTFPPTFLLFILLISANLECSLVVNKCCQKGMIFDKSLQCVDIPPEYPTKPFDWFPTNSIVDVPTLKVQKSRREFYLKLLETAVVRFGKRPECDESEIDSTSFTDEKPLFNFLLYDDSELRVHVSSNKTLHHHKDAFKFPVVEKDEMDGIGTGNASNGVTLRTFPIANVCVDAVLNSNRHRILICPCKSLACIRKCCKDEEYYNMTAENCSPLSEIPGNVQKWRPKDFELKLKAGQVEDVKGRAAPCEERKESDGRIFQTGKPITRLSKMLLLSLWLALHAVAAHPSRVLNKCCPQGQKFDENFNCTPMEESGHGMEKDSLSWFPLESVVNASTLKIHEHHRDLYLELFNNKFTANYGRMPNCSSEQTKQVAYYKTDVIEFYNFILYENLTMRIHVSKPGSMHQPVEEIIHFETVREDTEWADENNSTKPPIDSLRTFPIEDACVDLGLMNIHFLVYCPCRSMLCIRKCCKDDEYYNATSDECESVDGSSLRFSNWRPRRNGTSNNYYLLSDTFPSCDNALLLKLPNHAFKSCKRFNKESDNDFTIFSNGSVKVNKYKNQFQTHQYCGEVTWHENGKIYEQNLILCSGFRQSEQTNSWPLKSIIYGTLLIIGGICLFVTVAVSLYLPELRRRMHNKIALSHNLSLMVAYFTWGVGQLSPDLGRRSCMLIALIIQFTFLGSFFWLNVMCIDISMTFSATRSLGGHSPMGDYKKFVYYCIYSWGTTTVISVITMIMEFLPDIPYDFLKPGFACSCGFNTANASILIYFYGPMSVLLVFNLILFVFTSIKIMSVQRQTAILHKTDSNTTGGSSFQTDKQRYDLIQWLILYAKLFLLMGLTWITEIISWAVGGPDYYWYFSDILNLLRAVFIFILFICKRPVLESLRRKLLRDTMREEGCSKSLSDGNSTSTSVRDSRFRSSTNSRKESAKNDAAESQKLILKQRPGVLVPRNTDLKESCM